MGYSIDKAGRSSSVLVEKYVPDSAVQTSIRGLLTWIYITGTCPSGYPVRTVTRSPTRRSHSKPNEKRSEERRVGKECRL